MTTLPRLLIAAVLAAALPVTAAAPATAQDGAPSEDPEAPAAAGAEAEPAPDPADDLYRRGRALLLLGDPDGAAVLLGGALAADRDGPVADDALYWRARCRRTAALPGPDRPGAVADLLEVLERAAGGDDTPWLEPAARELAAITAEGGFTAMTEHARTLVTRAPDTAARTRALAHLGDADARAAVVRALRSGDRAARDCAAAWPDGADVLLAVLDDAAAPDAGRERALQGLLIRARNRDLEPDRLEAAAAAVLADDDDAALHRTARAALEAARALDDLHEREALERELRRLRAENESLRRRLDEMDRAGADDDK